MKSLSDTGSGDTACIVFFEVILCARRMENIYVKILLYRIIKIKYLPVTTKNVLITTSVLNYEQFLILCRHEIYFRKNKLYLSESIILLNKGKTLYEQIF